MASLGHQSESKHLESIIDSIPSLIHTARPDGYLDYFNQRWLQYVGLPIEELLGWKWTAAIHPEDVEAIVDKWRFSLASGQAFLHEARVRRADGKYRWMMHHKVAVHDEFGQIIKWYGSSIDIEDRKRAEEEVRRNAEELQRSAFYLAEAQRLGHIGGWVFDPTKGFDYWSQELFQIYGLDPATAAPTTEQYLALVHPQDREFMASLMKTMRLDVSGFDVTKRIVRPNGEVRYVRCVGGPPFDEDIAKRIGVGMDVTEHELLTQELRRREAYLSEAQRLSHTGSVGMEVSTGRIFWSEESARIYGYAPGTEPTRDLVLQRVHPDDVGLVKEALDRAARGGESFDFEHRLLMPDGSIKHVYNRAYSLRDKSGNEEIVGVIMDVTERKVAEEAIRRSEAYLTEGQRLSHTGSFGWRPETGEMVWTDETYRIFEYARAEKPTLDKVLERIHPQDRAHTQQIIEGLSRQTDITYEPRLVMPGGNIKYLHVRAHALPDSSGTFEIVGAVTDITERKAAEEKIRRLVDANIMGIFICNVEGRILETNEAFLRIVQYSREDLIAGGMNWIELTPPEWRERDQRAVVEATANGAVQPYEKELFRKDGSRVPVFVGGALFAGGHEGVAFVLDLSEQKQAEEALRINESYLKEAQRLSKTGSWAWSPANDIMYFSEECYRLLGFEPFGPPPSFETVVQRIHPDDQAYCRERVEKGIRDKLDFELDYRIVHPDKKVRDIHCVCHPVLDGSWDLVELLGTIIDITERKTAEGKIREQEMELRQMLDLAPQQVAVFGPGGERLYANRVFLDYIGLNLEEWRQTPGGLSRPGWFIHPDDRERAACGYFDSTRSGSWAFEVELRVQGADGSYRWFLVRNNPVRDEHGQIKRWYVASTDIHERKRAEEKLELENAALREEIDQTSMFEEIVGTSPALQTVLSRISRVAPSDSTVLITGETGTGKELVARAIHRRSQRSGRAFVSVNCAAIPHDLIFSELFGHERGAFTGATQRRLGRFEMADGGTIFLDEVGELLPETQVALLRVLQEREFERVGGGQPIRVDVRVIAATNRDLKAAVANGMFRQDLFYRLNVFPIEVPPLRERKGDILMLVEYFVQRYASRAGKHIASIDKKTRDRLRSYAWPGNIRELQNVIERSVILSSGEVLSVDEMWLSKETSRPASLLEASPRLNGEAEPRGEREIIEAALAEARGRVSGPLGAATRLRVPPSTLANRIKALKINKKQFKFR